MKTDWDLESAIATYNVEGWGKGYFAINSSGNVEAGSKPELVAALAMHKDPESLIICNGYKDPAFIRIALLGCKLDKSVIIVAEKLEELEQTIRAAKEVGVEPLIGIRVRLHTKGSGKWSPSGGENAKFGLDTTSLVAASQMLKEAG